MLELFRREPEACICPRGQVTGGVLYSVRMPGDPNGRLSTAKGCPEHDSCHSWTTENRAKYVIGRESWSVGPYCPIHATRNCPVKEVE